jgi:hypothetical protein
MQTIEQLLESIDIRVTAMRLLIYKFLAQKQVAVTLSDRDRITPVILNAIHFENEKRRGRTRTLEHANNRTAFRVKRYSCFFIAFINL